MKVLVKTDRNYPRHTENIAELINGVMGLGAISTTSVSFAPVRGADDYSSRVQEALTPDQREASDRGRRRKDAIAVVDFYIEVTGADYREVKDEYDYSLPVRGAY